MNLRIATTKINTTNPLWSPPGGGGGSFISGPFEEEGCLIETGGLILETGLFNLTKTMVSILP